MTNQSLQAESDEKLMSAIAIRDEVAFGRLYDRYSPAAYAVCMRILLRPVDANSVLSDVFLEIWQKAEHFNPSRGSVRTYIMMLSRSRAIDCLRADTSRRARETKYNQQRSDSMLEFQACDNPANVTIAGEEYRQLSDALAELSETQQQVLQLAYFQGKTHREIAEETEMPLGTIKTHIRQGLIKLGYLLRKLNSSWSEL